VQNVPFNMIGGDSRYLRATLRVGREDQGF
jgi:hypothetical protein